jgi:hypothetical protein
VEKDPTVEDLVELPRRVVKQPTPELNIGGDCGACVLAGLLGMTIEEVYAKLHPKKIPYHFDMHSMHAALQIAKYDLGTIDRCITRTPYWPSGDSQRAWGDASWTQSMEWREWLTMAFDAGYYALAQVRAIHEPMVFETDHWVLYCGTRTKWDGPPAARQSGEFQLLVSDSGRTKPIEAWFGVGEHLKQRGGFAVMLARPVNPSVSGAM